MFRNLAEDIVFFLVTHKIISIDERDIYIYGAEAILLNGSLLFVFFIISLLTDEIVNFLSYLLFFVPLRIFTGGYHAETSNRCFVLSTMMYGLSVLIIKIFPLFHTFFLSKVVGIVCIGVIILFSPLINKNNPLTQKQRKRNRIISYLILILDLIAYILCYNLICTISSSVLVFVMFDSFLLIIGKIISFTKSNNT